MHALLLLLVAALVGDEISFKELRLRMVAEQLVPRGITDERVLEAMRTVRRHEFMPEEVRHLAYVDSPVRIGHEQTISQPYIVAFMTQHLDLQPDLKLFEPGTGSGYQAAVASLLVEEVFTVEIVPELAERATSDLERLGYENVHVRQGDGWAGWPDEAPFDRIIVTAAAPDLPEPLLEQLADDGRMIIPVGPAGGRQDLFLVWKTREGEVKSRAILPVRFVPVTGDHGD
jgi:protein-L-isoaspartate(D-aspartate) O-methyltransferase